jgi:hypothetical protein
MTASLTRGLGSGGWLVWRDSTYSVSATRPILQSDGLIEVKLIFASSEAAANYEKQLKQLCDESKGNVNLTVSVKPA